MERVNYRIQMNALHLIFISIRGYVRNKDTTFFLKLKGDQSIVVFN